MVDPQVFIRLIRRYDFNQRPVGIAALDMQRTTCFRNAEYQAARAVLVIRIILNDQTL
jgi:hypothetical protein